MCAIQCTFRPTKYLLGDGVHWLLLDIIEKKPINTTCIHSHMRKTRKTILLWGVFAWFPILGMLYCGWSSVLGEIWHIPVSPTERTCRVIRFDLRPWFMLNEIAQIWTYQKNCFAILSRWSSSQEGARERIAKGSMRGKSLLYGQNEHALEQHFTAKYNAIEQYCTYFQVYESMSESNESRVTNVSYPLSPPIVTTHCNQCTPPPMQWQTSAQRWRVVQDCSDMIFLVYLIPSSVDRDLSWDLLIRSDHLLLTFLMICSFYCRKKGP